MGVSLLHPQVQTEIAATPELRTGGMLLLDESADAKAGTKGILTVVAINPVGLVQEA